MRRMPRGRCRRRALRPTGLPAGIPVAVGTGDDFSTPLGAGFLDPGQLAVVLGTGEVVGAVHPRLVIDDAGLVETHAYPGGAYFLENPGWLSGGAVSWLCELLSIDGFEALHAEAATVPPGAAGLTFIPALTGAMAPVWNAVRPRLLLWPDAVAHAAPIWPAPCSRAAPSPCATWRTA